MSDVGTGVPDPDGGWSGEGGLDGSMIVGGREPAFDKDVAQVETAAFVLVQDTVVYVLLTSFRACRRRESRSSRINWGRV